MGGGHIQIVTTGINDLYLTGDPQINWFKTVYRQYGEFSMSDIPINSNTDIQPGSTHYFKIKNEADKLNRLTMIVDIPTPELKMQDPIVETFNTLATSYDLAEPVYTIPKKPKDKVEYSDLFNNDPTSFGSTLVSTCKKLNKKYDARLDVLEYVTNTYSSIDGRFNGRYMALRSDKIQLPSQQISSKPIDTQGYLMLTYDKSLELLTSSNLITTLDPTSFVYRIDNNNQYSNTTQTLQPIPILPSDLPSNVPQIASSRVTTNKVAIVYPYTVQGFHRIETVNDIQALNTSEKIHVLLSVSDLINIKQRTLNLREHSQQLLQPDVYDQQTSINFDENIKLMYTNFDYTALLNNTKYLSGVYVFEIDPSITDEIYYQRVERVLNTSKISVDLLDVSTTIKKSNIVLDVFDTSNVFDPSNVLIDRFDIDQNVSYDPLWIYDKSSLSLSNDEKQTRGYWLVDLAQLDNQVVNDVLEIIDTSNGIRVDINPKYILSIQTQIGFSPFTIKREWVEVLTKTTIQPNPQNQSTLEAVTKKLANTPDGFTALAKIFNDLYQIPTIMNIGDIDPTSGTSFADITNLHTMLIKMLDDIVEYQSESRNYKLLNYGIYNSVDIRKLIYKKLIKDIIYVDQKKIVTNIPYTISKYMERYIDDNPLTDIVYTYEIASSFVPPSASDEYTFSRQIIYDTHKFLLWSYYLENLFFIYNPVINNTNEIRESLSYLSYMLLYISLDPTGIYPEEATPIVRIDDTTKNIRFAINSIDSIQKTIIYDDDSIIENSTKKHRMTGENDANIFDTHYIFASERFDNLSPQDAEFLDETQSEFLDGYRTCVNREVEVYHTVTSLNHTGAELNMTVYEHFMSNIIKSYEDPRNYLYTLAFRVVEQFLRTYYKDVKILNSTVQLDTISQDLGTLIIKTFNIVMTNYTKLLFKIWKNSTYSDIEYNPSFGTFIYYYNEDDYFVKNTTKIKYDPFYIINELKAMEARGDISSEQVDLGDPIKLRAKYYTGVDINLRPVMGYSNRYSIDMTNYDTLINPIESISNTDNLFGVIENFVDNAKSKDELTEHIHKSTLEMKADLQRIFISRDGSATPLSYLYWRDLNKTMQIIYTDLYNPLGTLTLPPVGPKYFSNVALLNHLPFAILYRYGQHLQYSIINNSYITQSTGIGNSDTTFDINRYNMYPIEIENDIDINRIYNVEPATVDGLKLRFMGTDVRIIPSCPFHGEIRSLDSLLEDVVQKFLITGDISFVCNPNDIDICPLCFRTFAYKDIHATILNKVLCVARPDVNDTYKIVDDELINSITKDRGVKDATLLKNTNINNFSDIQSEYSAFLYRPEEVFYDDVSRSYYITAIEYVVHRIVASIFKYGTIVSNIVSRDNVAFENWVLHNTPDLSIIDPSIIVDGTNEVYRYNEYVQYLRSLRTSGVVEFDHQIDKLCSILTQTSDSVNNFNIIKQILKEPNSTPYGTDVYNKYTEAISYIGHRYSIESSVDNYGLIPNVFYMKDNPSESGVKIVRDQFYTGNITYWALLQRRMIKLHNRLLNRILDPRDMTVNNILNTPEISKYINSTMTPSDFNKFVSYTKTRNFSPDICNEIYNILRKEFKPEYINQDGTLNFYRSKEIIEYSFDGDINEFRNPVSTSMINHCRQLMIFFNMLINRYNKMKFMLDIRNTSLNNESYFYNMSQTIASEYLKDPIQHIKQIKTIDVNSQDNPYIRQAFYYNDTSRYYFIDPSNFSKSLSNSTISINDYLSFSIDDSYHLSQAFTLNQMMSVFKMIGLKDSANAQLYISTTTQDKQLYYDDIAKGLIPVLNDDFKRYVSVDINTTILLNNYELYLREASVLYNPLSGYYFNIVVDNPKVDGIFNRIWYYAPTVSNILYDQYYRNVVIDQVYTNIINSTDPEYFNYDAIKHRTYTQCRLTSPLIFLIDKLTKSVNNVFTHTSNMQMWERAFHNTYAVPTMNLSSVLNILTPSEVIQMKQNELNSWSGLYSAYRLFVGSYNTDPVAYLVTEIMREFLVGDASIVKAIQNIRTLFDESIRRLIGGLSISNLILRRQHMLSAITLEYIRMQSTFDNILHTRSVNLTNLIQKLRLFKTNVLNLLPLPNSEQTIQLIFADLIEQIESLFRTSIDLINSLDLAFIITDIKQNIDTITNETQLRQMFELRINAIQSGITQIESDLQTIIANIISEIQTYGVVFIPSELDNRRYTPHELFNSTTLNVIGQLKTFKDVLYLILADIIKFVTPSDITLQKLLAFTSDSLTNTEVINSLDNNLDNTNISNIFIRSINYDSIVKTYEITLQNIKLSISAVYDPMSKICYLDRYIDPNRPDVVTFHRYNLDIVILGTETGINRSLSYNESKQKYIDRQKKTETGLTEHATRNIRQQNDKSRRLDLNGPITRYVSNNGQYTSYLSNSPNMINTYYESEIYNQIIKIFTKKKPSHAWSRYLGLKLIEQISLVIDGEQIDESDSHLMLMLHKLMTNIEYERGDNIMLGNIPEMYTISDSSKPAMRLYIQIPLFFCKEYGNSLNLINMLYSETHIKLKLRELSELLYIERGGELAKPIKIKCQLFGNYIYLGCDERRLCATTKQENLIERYKMLGPFIRGMADLKNNINTDFGIINNVLTIRYTFEDPTKYLIWRIDVEYPDSDDTDKIHWDLAGYRMRNANGTFDKKSKSINPVKNVMIEFNNKVRERWRESKVYQFLQPYNHGLNSLDTGEGIYMMCLYPRLLQPSGATNMSMLDNVTYNFEINQDIATMMRTNGLRLKIMCWECSYNLFVTMSGFGALRFYGAK
jgi:hypothetical protein